jgi:hypothetical protein
MRCTFDVFSILQLLTIMTGETLVSSGTAAQLLQAIKPNLVALQTEWCVPWALAG